MPYGLSEQHIQKIVMVLAQHQRVAKAVLYGSRAKGTHKPGSDIDLTLYGEHLSQKDMAPIYAALDALDLPYTIDLSAFERIEHAALREHIERVGVVLYQREGGCGGQFSGMEKDTGKPGHVAHDCPASARSSCRSGD